MTRFACAAMVLLTVALPAWANGYGTPIVGSAFRSPYLSATTAHHHCYVPPVASVAYPVASYSYTYAVPVAYPVAYPVAAPVAAPVPVPAPAPVCTCAPAAAPVAAAPAYSAPIASAAASYEAPALAPATVSYLSSYPASYQRLYLDTFYGSRAATTLYNRYFSTPVVRAPVITPTPTPTPTPRRQVVTTRERSRTVIRTRP